MSLIKSVGNGVVNTMAGGVIGGFAGAGVGAVAISVIFASMYYSSNAADRMAAFAYVIIPVMGTSVFAGIGVGNVYGIFKTVFGKSE